MANELMVEGQLYDWLMDNGYTSEENAHDLAGLTQRSGIQVPGHMRRNGKLLNFFKDRSNIFGIVRGTDEAQNPSIYARDFRQEYRGRPARGRGGLRTYVNRRDAAQAAADARLSRLREYVADSAASEQREIDRNTPGHPSYNWNPLVGGKYSKSKSKSKSRSAKKSKSRSRSGRKSRSRKNRNRRSKSKSRN
jgi:hypothetical protein